MKINRIDTVLLFLLVFTFSFSPTTKTFLFRLVKKMTKNGYYSCPPDGFFLSHPSEQYSFYLKFKEIATPSQLVEFTDHKSPAVRVYAFKALESIKHDSLFEIAKRHIHDTAWIKESCFDYLRNMPVGDFFVGTDSISIDQRNRLDSLLIYQDNKLRHTNTVIRNLETSEKYYDRIKMMSVHRETAIIALAKYQKQSDIPFIQEQLHRNYFYSIRAIEYFPAPEFKSTILDLNKRGANHFGNYFSVAVYKDSFSLNYFFEKLANTNADYFRKIVSNNILTAIEKYRTSIYDDLYFKIWEKDNVINSSAFKYLIKVDSVRSKNLALGSLKITNELDNSDLIIVDMLNFIIEKDTINSIELLADRIKNQSVHNFGYFSEACQKIKHQKITEALFNRLKDATNGHIYTEIVATLVSYNDKIINRILLKVVPVNTNIEGWGKDRVEKIMRRITNY